MHTVRTAWGCWLRDLTKLSPKLGVWRVSDSCLEIKRTRDRCELILWWIQGEQLLCWEGWHSLSLLGQGLVHVSMFEDHMWATWERKRASRDLRLHQRGLPGRIMGPWYWEEVVGVGVAWATGKPNSFGEKQLKEENAQPISRESHLQGPSWTFPEELRKGLREESLMSAKPPYNCAGQAKVSLWKKGLATMAE